MTTKNDARTLGKSSCNGWVQIIVFMIMSIMRGGKSVGGGR